MRRLRGQFTSGPRKHASRSGNGVSGTAAHLAGLQLGLQLGELLRSNLDKAPLEWDRQQVLQRERHLDEERARRARRELRANRVAPARRRHETAAAQPQREHGMGRGRSLASPLEEGLGRKAGVAVGQHEGSRQRVLPARDS